MFSLLGMQLFGGGCGSDESRFHFDYFYPAMLTTLSIFSGGWVDPYNACSETSVPLARGYTLLALVIGYFVIFNLFIAILLDSFASDEEEEEEEEEADSEEEGDGKVDSARSADTVMASLGAPVGGGRLPAAEAVTIQRPLLRTTDRVRSQPHLPPSPKSCVHVHVPCPMSMPCTTRHAPCEARVSTKPHLPS